MVETCKPTISEPFIYRVYVQSAIIFYLACFEMCKPTISDPGLWVTLPHAS